MLRTCKKHGEHEDWRIQKPYGKHISPDPRCRPCDRERQEASKQQPWRIAARHRERAKATSKRRDGRELYRAAVHAALLDQYGVGVADQYWAALQVAGDHGRVDVRRLLRSIIATAHSHLSTGNIGRVLRLNEITSRPLTNVGWSCKACHIESVDPGFFDIDHIVPSSVIGRRTYRDKGNLQVLCPNCHRCKTLRLREWYEAESLAVA